MFGYTKTVYAWAVQKVNSRFAPLWLGVIFFFELIFFLPMDAILLIFCLENPTRRYHYAVMAMVGSVASGLVGYFLGFAAWEVIHPYILDHLFSTLFFENLTAHYLAHQNWAVFLGSLLPVPFKAVTLSAGVCELAIFPFVGMVIVARSVRFFFIAQLIHRWGTQIKSLIDRHLYKFFLAIGAKIALAILVLWMVS